MLCQELLNLVPVQVPEPGNEGDEGVKPPVRAEDAIAAEGRVFERVELTHDFVPELWGELP